MLNNYVLLQKNHKKNDVNSLRIILIFYKIILDVLYYGVISKIFNYYGFIGGFSISWYIFSWVISICFIIWMVKLYKYNNNLSIKILFFLSLLSFYPFLSMIASNYDTIYKISNLFFWFFTYVFVSFFSKIRNKSISLKINEKRFINIFLVTSIFIVLIITGLYSNFRFTFNIWDVYDTRSEAALVKIPTFLRYLFNWTRIIIPILITYMYIKKRYMLVFFLFVLQIFSFSFDGLKLVAFTTFVALCVPIIYRIFRRKPFQMIVASIVLVNILSLIEYFVLSDKILLSIFPFRTLFLPNLIGTWFFDFFQNNTPDFFRSSFLRHFGLLSPYSKIGIDYIISGLYFGNFSGRANNGLISDAMTNFGYPGIILLPIMIAFVLHLFDKFSQNIDEKILIVFSIYFSYSFTNTFLPVILVTYGGFVVMFFFSGINSNKYDNRLIDKDNNLLDDRLEILRIKRGNLNEKK